MSQPQPDETAKASNSADSERLARHLALDLSSSDPAVRDRARDTLVAIGEPAADIVAQQIGRGNQTQALEAVRVLRRLPTRWPEKAGPRTIAGLVRGLSSRNGEVREACRLWLVSIGRPAVPALVSSLKTHVSSLRWEAAKALCDIADPESAEALARTLEDEQPGIRWLAAEALAGIGRPAIQPLLEALVKHPGGRFTREGARFVLERLVSRDEVGPLRKVLDALLESGEPDEGPVLAAEEALRELDQDDPGRPSAARHRTD